MLKKLLILLWSLGLTACQTEHKDTAALDSCIIAIEEEPNSFDPRLIRTTCSVSIAHLIGEGLFRFNEAGALTPALLQSWELDESGKKYTFTLKNAHWSNGDLITAKDFERTIQSVLSPNTPSPHAHQLYAILNSKQAKEGSLPLEDIGVKALDDKTLVIELHEPTPGFLKLLATHFLFPVHAKDLTLDHKDPCSLMASGPYAIETCNPTSEIVLKKNDHFWDAQNVHLKTLKLMPINEQLALQMFEAGEMDWVGSPIGRLPPDAIPKLKEDGRLKIHDALGTFWLRVNTLDDDLPLHVRKALFDAVDRDEIVKHITQGGQKPASTIVPPALLPKSSFESQALSHLNIPETITLSYVYNERNHKLAQYLEQKWKEKLGLHLVLEAQESKAFYEKSGKGQFQLSIGSWFADAPDALNFLEVFKYKDAKTNGTGFENHEYTALLDQASREMDEEKRMDLMKQSEKILMEAYPVIPLYFAVFNSVSNPNLKGVFVSPLGFFDFRHARKE